MNATSRVGSLALLVASLQVHASPCIVPGDTLFAADFETPAQDVYYVAANGSNGNTGAIDSPWLTAQHAADAVAAGDTVCIRAGVYNEVVSITHSGSAAAGAIAFQAVPGQAVIVDGSSLAVPNNQWGLITLSEVSYVTVRGFELRNFTTTSTASVPIGLYVTGAGSTIVLIGNHIHDIRNTAASVAANAFGIKVDGTHAPASINLLTIANNEIDHLTLGSSETFSLDGNVEQWTISGNTVHDTNNIGIGAIGFEGVAPDPAYDQARDGTISGNTVYNITSFGNPAYGSQYAADGIYIDGGTRIVIERNRVHHVDIGIELASEHSGRTTSYTTARNNLVYLNNSAGISLGGYDGTVGGTDHCTVANNTLFRDDQAQTGAGELQIQYHATNNLVANNIFHATTQGVLLYAYTGDTPAPASLDYNLYFSDAGSAGSTWTWLGTDYTTFSAYRAASLQDAHAQFADPKFVSLSTPDLHAQAGSPAIDAGSDYGVNVVGTLDFDVRPRIQGAAIDIGPYEQ
jgi:hypothetical protein